MTFRPSFPLRLFVGLLVALLGLGTIQAAHAATHTTATHNGTYARARDAVTNDVWNDASHDHQWSDATNWSLSVVPGPNDVAVFSGQSTNEDVTIDVVAQINELQIPDYSGTITVQSNLTISGCWCQSSGTVNVLGSQAVAVGGDWSVSGPGATFNSGQGTVAISGLGSHYLDSGYQNFNNLTLSDATQLLHTPLRVAGTLQSNGTLDTNHENVSAGALQLSSGSLVTTINTSITVSGAATLSGEALSVSNTGVPSGEIFPVLTAGTLSGTFATTTFSGTVSYQANTVVLTAAVTGIDLALTNVPTDVTAVATSPSGAVVTYASPTVNDDSGQGGVVNCAPASGSTFAIGPTAVTCTTTDADDTPSTMSATFMVTVSKVPSTTTTQVINDATGKPPTGTEAAGSSFHDTAAVTGNGSTTVSGTVTYSYFTNGSCAGTASSTQTVTLGPTGAVPDSATTGPLAAGSYSFSATYAGDNFYNSSSSSCEPFTVISDTDLGLANMPGTITTNATGPNGATVTYTPPTATDESGDNPTPTVNCMPASGSTFAIGMTTVTCTATDSDDTPGTVSGSFSVIVQPVLTVSGANVNPTEGSAFSGVVATGIAYGTTNPLSASIAWGDGSNSTGSVTLNPDGSYSVSGSHTYAEEGPFALTVTVTDSGSLSAKGSGSAKVADAALTLTHFVAGPLGHRLAGVAAIFTDADPAGQVSDYTATITWGDGTTSTVKVITNPLGKGFVLAGLHSYAKTGTYTVTLTVTDTGGSQLTKTVTVTVK